MEAMTIRPERKLANFSRGLELIQAIKATWKAIAALPANRPWPPSAAINPLLEEVIAEFDLTYGEWHYWCDIAAHS